MIEKIKTLLKSTISSDILIGIELLRPLCQSDILKILPIFNTANDDFVFSTRIKTSGHYYNVDGGQLLIAESYMIYVIRYTEKQLVEEKGWTKYE